MVLVKRIRHRLHDQGMRVCALDGGVRDGAGGQIIGGEGQVRAMLLGRAHGEHDDWVGSTRSRSSGHERS